MSKTVLKAALPPRMRRIGTCFKIGTRNALGTFTAQFAEHPVWETRIAQCIEYDIAVRAETLLTVSKALKRGTPQSPRC